MPVSLMRMTRPLLVVVLCAILGCTAVPHKYVRESVPHLTFSTLAANPQLYQNRLVILGAVIVKKERRDGDIWLHVKNRPLNKEYRPQLPSSPHNPDAGWYWIVIEPPQTLPDSYHQWAEMTVVGRVAGFGPGKEPLLKMVYVHGWGLASAHHGVWEHTRDLNYIAPIPRAIRGELGQQ